MKYTVCVKIDGYFDVEVNAESFEQARELAEKKAGNQNWNCMDVADITADFADDENGAHLDFYEEA